MLARHFFKIDRTVLIWGSSMEELLTNRGGEKFYPRSIHHLGMVGAFIKESGIIETIDKMIPKTSTIMSGEKFFQPQKILMQSILLALKKIFWFSQMVSKFFKISIAF